MKTFITLTIILFLVGVGCVPGKRTNDFMAADNKLFTVLMQPKPAKGELQIKSIPQGYGKGGKKNGYVGFGEGEFGTITFALKGEETGDQCAPDGSAEWVITKIAFSDDGDPATEKGNNFGKEQDDWLVNAFPGVAKSDGVLYDEKAADGSSSVPVIDLNDHPKAEGVKIAYYQVIATECENGMTVETDPGITNRGK